MGTLTCVSWVSSCAGWWVMLLLHSPPFFPSPPPLLSRANSWVALSWQDKHGVLTPFPLVLLLPNGNTLRLMKSFMILSRYWLMKRVNEWTKCAFGTNWCVSGPWLRRTGSFFYTFAGVSIKQAGITKQLGSGAERRIVGCLCFTHVTWTNQTIKCVLKENSREWERFSFEDWKQALLSHNFRSSRVEGDFAFSNTGGVSWEYSVSCCGSVQLRGSSRGSFSLIPHWGNNQLSYWTLGLYDIPNNFLKPAPALSLTKQKLGTLKLWPQNHYKECTKLSVFLCVQFPSNHFTDISVYSNYKCAVSKWYAAYSLHNKSRHFYLQT